MGRPKVSSQVENVVLRIYQAGGTMAQAATAAGVSVATARNILIREGVEIRKRSIPIQGEVEKDFLLQVQEDLTAALQMLYNGDINEGRAKAATVLFDVQKRGKTA